MAIVRGWAIRAGAGVDDQCLAHKLAWEEDSDTLDATVLGRCPHATQVEYLGTGVCTEHHRLLQPSKDRKVYRPTKRGDAMP